ncbi:hypothetical protein AA650_16660 [Anabaena sp. WA102]|uniref:isopeptide-forming domain-containing fimbrial protein n=1 Tax=Anabaena sp. WA102 TaxID=1647413 RepID=UPI0006AC0BFD|nr:isopeptide-forming domain-containing fimbrial protein [Anabaena sp. WA102]ALB41865.1 hypothetical protein AA650_16660 [Anabaena sp. WA102]
MLNKIKRPPRNYSKKLITSLAFIICIWGQSLQPVSAEGSKDLVKNSGYRPYTEWLSGVSLAGIPRTTLLKVYVQQGEVINLGSSVPTSYGGGTQDIVYRSPNGTQNGACNVLSTGFGFIDTYAKETAGPLPAAGGYTPCQIVATQTGVYEVEFHGPSSNSTANPPILTYNAAFPTDATQYGTVAAWDITVTSNGVVQPGRVFTNYLSLNMGGNSGGSNPNDLGIYSKLFVQTKDGYRYRVELEAMDPGNFIFFGNSRGFIDKGNSNNITNYHSITATTEALNFTIPSGVVVQPPTVADTTTDITHRVFFNTPASVALTGLVIPLTATLPQAPTNFKFTGTGNTNTTTVGVGGNFSFTTNQIGKYQIIIDTDKNGVYGDNNDRVLTGSLLINNSNYSVIWDVKDAAGVTLPVGNYNAKVYNTAGEYHFPLLDVESNARGMRIFMENPPGAFSGKDADGVMIDDSTIYYDDSNYTTKNGTPVNLDPTGTQTVTIPRDATKGVNTRTDGRHEWGRLYGDKKGIDTWTYFMGPSQNTAPIVIVGLNVVGTKQVAFQADNDSSNSVTIDDIVEYTVTYSNLAPGNLVANSFVIKDTLPAQLTYEANSATLVSKTTGNDLVINSSYNGTSNVNLTNTGTLRIGDTVTIKFRARVNTAGVTISNQAIANFNTANPTVTVTTLTDAVPTTTGVTKATVPGDIFQQTANDGIETGNASDNKGDDDPTLFFVPLPAKLLLVKRITALNGITTDFTGFDNSAPTPEDTDTNWPDSDIYLRGKINGSKVQPGDILEYTIYFLSRGDAPAVNTKICDLVPDGLEFVPTGFNSDTAIPSDSGITATTADFGIVLGWNSTDDDGLPSPATPLTEPYLLRLTGAGTDTDAGEFFAAGVTPSTTCAATNTNGAIVVKIGGSTAPEGIPQSTGVGTPVGSYGFFRFRAKVK